MLMNNKKLFIRQLFKKKRSELTDNQVKILNKRILKNLTTIKIWDNNFYHLYLSNDLNKEVETDKLINLLFDKNKRVFVPKIIGKDLIHIEINKSTSYSKNPL